MLSKNKYVSSLDLKYLDAKFIAIHDSQQEIHSNLNEIRKSKTTELPSIFKSMHDDDTTLYTSNVLPESRLESIISRPAMRYQSVDRSAEKSSTQDEMIEVNKYKKLIAKIKTDNDLLHKEIINLYRDQKIGAKEPKKKAIRTIIQPAKDFLTKSASALRLTSETKQYQRVYEDLTKQDNPYRKQSLELQKKFMNNNFHKNFQNFLISRNKRVPEFIKNIR